MDRNVTFSEERSYDFTEKISFPRLFGSEGNKRVREIIKETFKSSGYEEVLVNKFVGSFKENNFMVVLLLSIMILNSLFMISYFISSSLNILLFFAMLLFLRYLVRVAAAYEPSSFEETEDEGFGENIFTVLTPHGKKAKATLIFMAHYDTKSQGIGILARIVCYLILYFVGLVWPFLVFFGSLYNSFFYRTSIFGLYEFILVFLVIIICICAVVNIICTVTTANESPGSIDNGTAVATVQELARIFHISPPENINIVFLCTDCEEIGLQGSTAFVKQLVQKGSPYQILKNRNIEIDKNNTFIVNFELLGLKNGKLGIEESFGLLSKTYTNKELNQYIREAASPLKLAKVDSMIGSVADHIPFLNHGYKVTMLNPSLSNLKLNFVHTKKDNMSLVCKKKLGEVGSICQRFVQMMDQKK